MVLVGKVNKDIVLRIGRHGQPAIGLCGDDGQLFQCEKRTAPGGEDVGFVGRITKVDGDVLNHITSDYIPVIASVGSDAEGNSYNVNADEAAGAVAAPDAGSRRRSPTARTHAQAPGATSAPHRRQPPPTPRGTAPRTRVR